MKLTRVISVYEKHGEDFIREFSLDHISLEILKKILNAKDDDPDLYSIYPIDKSIKDKLILLVPELSLLNESDVKLFYECFTE